MALPRGLLAPCWLVVVLLGFGARVFAQQVERPPAPPPSASLGAIAGRVFHAPDTPVPSVTIVARNAAGIEAGAISDNAGAFRIENLPAARFDVEVRRGEQILATLKAIDVELGATRSLSIELPPPAPDPKPAFPQRPGGTAGTAIPESETPPHLQSAEQPGIERPTQAEPPSVQTRTSPLGPAFVPVKDRWQRLPSWTRYPSDSGGDHPYVQGHWWDPYNQNRLKADYPVFGGRWFLSLSGASETLVEGRRLPVSSVVMSGSSGSRGEQLLGTENLVVSAELFHGLTVFRPVDVRFRVTPVLNANRLHVRESGLLGVDPGQGLTRWDRHAALQEAFVEIRLANVGPRFDGVSLRVGTQSFNSDFRGFIFFDNEPGIRLTGSLGGNRSQYNVAWFHMLEKDTNSLLNTFASRNQNVWIANLTIQDFARLGYTTAFSVHVNDDRPGARTDANGFAARPSPMDAGAAKRVRTVYLGWTSDGHFGGLNVNHAFYQALGSERFSATASAIARRNDINARMAAVELSADRDWIRYKMSAFYASGDDDAADSKAQGFDAIFDNPLFAGGAISLWNRQSVRLPGTGLGLNQRFSLLPSLRTSREQGQANFVNPGLVMISAGADAELTTKLRVSAAASYLTFARANAVEAVMSTPGVPRSIGLDVGIGVTWRPLLNNNVIARAGAAALTPGAGLRSILTSQTLLSTFLELRFAY